MIRCNWHENIENYFHQDSHGKSWSARDFTLTQGGCEESLEVTMATVCHVISTCRTVELYTSAGYLRSIRGNLLQEEEGQEKKPYQLYEVSVETTVASDLTKVRFLSNSHVPKSDIFFRQLTILTTSTKRAVSASCSIDTSKVREMLRDIPHNEASSSAVLSMMDSMSPTMAMMCPRGSALEVIAKSAATPPVMTSSRGDETSSDMSRGLPSNARDIELSPENSQRPVAPGICSQDHDLRMDDAAPQLDMRTLLAAINSPATTQSLIGMIGSTTPSAPAPAPIPENSRAEAKLSELKNEVEQLRSELRETKSTVLQAIADSESRILDRMDRLMSLIMMDSSREWGLR